MPKARLRLVLGSSRGAVDGVWWPRSADLAVEIIPLGVAITGSLAGHVTEVFYDRRAWLPEPSQLPHYPGQLETRWVTMADPRQVSLVLDGGKRIVLQVIPASIPDASGRRAMREAFAPAGGPASTEVPGRVVHHVVRNDGQHRWFGTGGPAVRPAFRA
jgi:hypothetical protein